MLAIKKKLLYTSYEKRRRKKNVTLEQNTAVYTSLYSFSLWRKGGRCSCTSYISIFTASLPIWINSVGLFLTDEIN